MPRPVSEATARAMAMSQVGRCSLTQRSPQGAPRNREREERERRFRVYEQAPAFRPGPRCPALTALGFLRLELKHDETLSTFASKFKLRRYPQIWRCRLTLSNLRFKRLELSA